MWVFFCTCSYACLYVFICVHVCVCDVYILYVSMCVHIRMCVCVIHVCLCVCGHVCVYVCVCGGGYACVHACVGLCVCVWVYSRPRCNERLFYSSWLQPITGPNQPITIQTWAGQLSLVTETNSDLIIRLL